MGKTRPLTERQTDIVKHIALGYSSAQIAERLHITAKTVDTHRNRIYRKLKLHGAVETVWYAISSDLVTMEGYNRARAFRSTKIANVAQKNSNLAAVSALVAPEEKHYRTVFLLTEEERAKKRPGNLNGGRPPSGASKEQLAVWHRDMKRREEFRKLRHG
jgi:DNA-binding CsgD family transcriptional regulator